MLQMGLSVNDSECRWVPLWSGLSVNDSGCGWVMRGARLRKRTCAKLCDEAYLRRERCSSQYMRNLYCLASELHVAFLAFLMMQ